MGDTALDAKTALTEATARLDRLETQFNKMGTFPAASNESGTQNNATWNVNAGGVGVWMATVCAMLAAFAMYVAADTRAEIRAERLSREIMNKWTAQEVTAIRSYITTGKLAPMNPPPVQEDKQ